MAYRPARTDSWPRILSVFQHAIFTLIANAKVITSDPMSRADCVWAIIVARRNRMHRRRVALKVKANFLTNALRFPRHGWYAVLDEVTT